MACIAVAAAALFACRPGGGTAVETGHPGASPGHPSPDASTAIVSAVHASLDVARPDALWTPDDATARRYPVRWSKDLELRSLDEVEGALSDVDPDGFGELQRQGETATAHTCRERSVLLAKGYAPINSAEAQADSGARIRCGTLELLKQAKQSSVSFVHDLRFDSSALAVLPASVATALSPERVAAVAAATQQGKSLKSYDPRARVDVTPDSSALLIHEGGDQSAILITPQAWGDIDGDGTEDVIVYVVNAMTRGTYRSSRLMVLTRGRSDAVLREIPTG